MLVFVEYAAEPVSSADVELGWFGERLGDRPERSAAQGSMVPVLVVEGLEAAYGYHVSDRLRALAFIDGWPVAVSA